MEGKPERNKEKEKSDKREKDLRETWDKEKLEREKKEGEEKASWEKELRELLEKEKAERERLEKELQEKDAKVGELRQLLMRAVKKVKESKKEAEDFQKAIPDLKKQIEQLEWEKTAKEEFMRQGASVYIEKINALQKELASVKSGYEATQKEFHEYKIKAHNALKQREVVETTITAPPQQQQPQQQQAQDTKAVEESQAMLSEIVAQMREANTDLKKSEETIELLREQLRQKELKNEELNGKQTKMRNKREKRDLRWVDRCKEIEKAQIKAQKQHNAEMAKLRSKHAEELDDMNARFEKCRKEDERNLQERDDRINKLIKEQRVLEQRMRLLTQMGNNPNSAGGSSNLSATSKLHQMGQENGEAVPQRGPLDDRGGGQDRVKARTNQGKSKLGEKEDSTGEGRLGEAMARMEQGSPQMEHMLYFQQMKKSFTQESNRLKATISERTEALNESEARIRLHLMQEKVLKEEIREMERSTKREVSDIDHLKEVVVKYLTGGDQDVLLPVMAGLLQFSREEIHLINERRQERQDKGLWDRVWGT